VVSLLLQTSGIKPSLKGIVILNFHCFQRRQATLVVVVVAATVRAGVVAKARLLTLLGTLLLHLWVLHHGTGFLHQLAHGGVTTLLVVGRLVAVAYDLSASIVNDRRANVPAPPVAPEP